MYPLSKITLPQGKNGILYLILPSRNLKDNMRVYLGQNFSSNGLSVRLEEARSPSQYYTKLKVGV